MLPTAGWLVFSQLFTLFAASLTCRYASYIRACAVGQKFRLIATHFPGHIPSSRFVFHSVFQSVKVQLQYLATTFGLDGLDVQSRENTMAGFRIMIGMAHSMTTFFPGHAKDGECGGEVYLTYRFVT